MEKYFYYILIVGLLVSCGKKDDFVDYDLVQHGLSLKIKAPVDPEVKVTDLGIMKDVTVKKGDNFDIQILSSKAITYDIVQIISDKKEEVQTSPFFSKIVSEEDNGFIFEKIIDEENIKYDFRAVKILGDTEYLFQSGLLGNFSLEDAESMFRAIQ